jgi:hypothetical protein
MGHINIQRFASRFWVRADYWVRRRVVLGCRTTIFDAILTGAAGIRFR